VTVNLSIITATAGRPGLGRALASVAPQLEHGDELLVVRRDGAPRGNQPRDEAMGRCVGSHLWWMDDDDIATDGALVAIRAGVAQDPDTVHIFRMDATSQPEVGRVLWDEPVIEFGRVGGTMCVVPNIPGKLGTWIHDNSYGGQAAGRGGDYHFIAGTLQLLGRDPIWHEEIIARIRP
jgi:hypothetical protein